MASVVTVMDRRRFDVNPDLTFTFNADPDPDPILKLGQVENLLTLSVVYILGLNLD
jgi:hypothetical protein